MSRRSSGRSTGPSSIIFPIFACWASAARPAGWSSPSSGREPRWWGRPPGLIDLVRTEGLPKNLRDDYTAFSLASVGYAMLHTTALSLGDQEAADLALQHYQDYAGAVMRFNDLIPAAVVRFLQQEGLPAREDVVQQVDRHIEEAWRRTAKSPANEAVSARRVLRPRPGSPSPARRGMPCGMPPSFTASWRGRAV